MASKISIGNVPLRTPVVYAPLAGFSDYPYRLMSALYTPSLMFCEMVKVEGLLYASQRTLKILTYSEEMRPIGGQICGSDPDKSAEAAKIVENLGFDLIDLNCGCPTDKITRDGSGSAMLKDPRLMGRVIESIVSSVSVPVTVKIRIGWDLEHINVEEVVRIISESGAKAVFIHGRTRSQGYTGLGNREYIKKAKAAVGNSLLVFGNGDIFTPESALDMLQTTGCDGVLIARGTMGNPWLGQQIEEFLTTGQYRTIPFHERKEAFIKHLHFVEEYYQSEAKLLTETRKLCGHYLVSASKVRYLRRDLATAKTSQEVYSLLEQYFIED